MSQTSRPRPTAEVLSAVTERVNMRLQIETARSILQQIRITTDDFRVNDLAKKAIDALTIAPALSAKPRPEPNERDNNGKYS